MSDLVEFLRARLDEDEAAAKAARGDDGRLGHGFEVREDWRRWVLLRRYGSLDVVDEDGNQVTLVGSPAIGEHIARHDPARVLREVAAKRRLLDHHAISTHMRWVGFPRADRQERYCHADQQAAPCRTLLALASVYADHPDYRQEWERAD